MAEHLNALFVVTGWAFLVGATGAFFALGFAGVCRWLKWSPVNVTVTINNPPGIVSTIASTSPPQEKR